MWRQEQRHLWVNAVVQPGGFLQVAVLRRRSASQVASAAGTTVLFEPVPGLTWENSSVGGLPPNSCVDPAAPSGSVFDSTRAAVVWRAVGGGSGPAADTDLAAVAGEVVQLQFRLSGASLYSFFVSETICGESTGFLGGGGPGSLRGRDMKGSCV